MEVKLIEFEKHGDERGTLIALEQWKNIPFEVRRVYYMYETGAGVVRGHHAHKHLKQVLICVHGSCKIRLDDGQEKKIVPLDDPSTGLYLESNIWREMFDFSEDEGLIVLGLCLIHISEPTRPY